MPIFHPAQTLDLIGPFNSICPPLSVLVAFLPSFLYTIGQVPKVGFFLWAWYALVFYFSNFPVVVDPEIFSYPNDLSGFLVFATLPFVGISLFYFGLYLPDKEVQQLMHEWPIAATCAQQFYRLGGAVFWYLYSEKEGYDSYFNLQTGVLDITMGVTALPMALYVIWNKDNLKGIKDILWWWHVVGMYDLATAFTMAAAHYFGIITFKHSLGYIACSPITLICYYQVAWAMGTHALCLTKLDEIIEAQSVSGGDDDKSKKEK